MAQAVLTSITRRSVVAGLALTGAPQGPKGEAVARYRHEGRRNVDRIVIAPDRGLRVVGSVCAVGRAEPGATFWRVRPAAIAGATRAKS